MSEESGGEKVPLWIISFADMITLLLAFFVMLQTMARSRDNTMMRGAQRGFTMALKHMGLPDFLFEDKTNEGNVDYRRLRYPDLPETEMPADPSLRSADPKDKLMEEVYQKIVRTMETQSEDVQTNWLATFPLTAKFPPHSANLAPAANDVLKQVAKDIAASAGTQNIEILIFASAPDESDPSSQWQLSAVRAAAIDKALTQAFKETRLPVRNISTLPWGCGDGKMIHELADDYRQCQAVIVVTAN